MQTIALTQRGLFTRNQARRAGVHDMWLARMKDDEVDQVQHGVWCLTDAPDDHYRVARTAILMLDADGTSLVPSPHQPHCVISHLTAAVIHGMCERLPTRIQRPVVTTTTKIVTTRRVEPIHGLLSPSEIVWIDGLPVTSTERTIDDLQSIGFEHFADGRVSRRTGT